MKKQNLLKTIFITLSLILLGGEVKANGTEVGGIHYTFDGTNATVTFTGATYSATSSYTGDIIIPSSVDYDNKTYTVVAIASNAFYNASSVTSITLPTTLTTINNTAFDGCSSLTSINIPENVTSIGMNAFRNCTALANVVYNATSCGNLYSGAFTASTAAIFTLTIGDNVTSIPNSLFTNTTHLTTVTIPASVVTIGNYAFSGCSGLTTLIIGEGVTTINKCAFQNCTGLTSVTLNATLTTIPTSSSDYAFKGCSCNNPCTLTVGATVTSIPIFTFGGLSNVTTVYFNATTCSDFNTTMNYAMPSVPGSEPYASLYIGDNVTRIPAGMFKSKKLAHITIGSSVIAIGDEAFNSGSSITSEIISKPSTPPTAGTNAFQLVNKNNPTYVPAGTKAAYQAATGWSLFTNYKEFDHYTSTETIADDEEKEMIVFSAGGQLTIANGAKLTCINIVGATTDNLIIADGGQLITSSNNVAATVQKSITGHGAKADFDGWTFIASPVVVAGGVNPEDVSGMTEGNFDLYRFNENADLEWENYKNTAAHSDFKLVNGKGYLYANEAEASLNFEGTVNPSTPNIEVSLQFNEGKRLAGWNLVGNPFTADAYITDRDYYRMVYDKGRVVIDPEVSSSGAIRPCEGVMVKATGAEQVVTFTTTEPAKSSNNGNVQIALAQNVTTRGESSSQTLDKAIISFNEDDQLGKFYFGNQDANLYIPMDNEEYAIVSSSAQGEMPVNFKAHRDGQYTITVNPQEVEMGYLLLIDNVAGKDIDLLATPSYTFNAKADDYESRFRLVFSANMVNADLDDDFAFFSNGQLVIANEGESLLQVIDVNGRIVTTESVSGTCSKAINVKAGVYVLRLIQGSDVKTQKIIVK